MTVVSEYPLADFIAPGSPAAYPVPFTYELAAELIVSVKIGSADAVTQILGADYIVSGAGLAGTGQVSFLPGRDPVPGATVKIARSTSIQQAASFGDQAGLLPSLIGRAFDRLTRIAQEVARDATLGGGGGGGGGGGASTWADLGAKPAHLTAYGALSPVADRLAYHTGASTMALATLTATGRQIMAAASMAAAFTLLAPTVARGDIIVDNGLEPERLAVGSDGQVLTADATSPVGVKWASPAGGGGGGAPTWSDVTSKPANVVALAGLSNTANAVPYFTGSGMATFTATSFSRGVMASTDAAAWRLALGVQGGGFANLEDYGGVGDGATNNASAFAAAASAAKRVWLEGDYYTTGNTAGHKGTWGPGRIKFGSVWRPARYLYLTAEPTAGVGGGLGYFFSGDISNIDAEHFIVGVAGGTMRIGLNQPYFQSTTTPHFQVFQNASGYSGMTAKTTAGITTGATSVTVNVSFGGANELTNGTAIAFASTVDGGAIHTATVSGLSGSTLTFSPAVPAATTIPSGTFIYIGKRTMNPLYHQEITHRGGGDCYAIVSRMEVNYPPTAGQGHVFYTATGGLYGGDLVASTSGVYLTGIEMQLGDAGNDAAAIGIVLSYDRNNAGGARGAFWSGIYMQSTGLHPINNGIVLLGKYTIGLDLVVNTDFGTNKAAIALKTGDRIYFNNRATPRGDFTTVGDTFDSTPVYIDGGNDGQFFWRAMVGTTHLRLRGGGVNTNGSMTVGGSIGAGTDISLGYGGTLAFGAGSGNYIQLDASSFRVYRSGILVFNA